MKKIKYKTLALYIVLFAVVYYIVKCAPFLSDDYIFLSCNAGTIKAAWYESLHYGNGRLFGNFITAFLIQYPIAMDIVRALMITLLIILLPKTIKSSDDQNDFLYTVISAVLLLGMSPLIFSEVFSWASGCNNYVPPVLLSVLCFLLVENKEKSQTKKGLVCFLIAIVGLSAQLFLELSTLVNICFTVVLIVYYYCTDREKLSKACIWFASSAVGGVIMYIIPRRFKPLGLVDIEKYREVNLGSINDIISSVFSHMFTFLNTFSKNEVIYITISLITIIMLNKQKNIWKRSKMLSLCKVSVTVATFFVSINCFIDRYTVYTKFEVRNNIVLVAAIIIILSAFVVAVLHLPKNDKKNRFIICIFFSMFSICPMLVVSPFGNRCMFICYIFIVVAVITIFDYVIKELPAEKVKAASGISGIVLATLAFCLVITFSDICWMDTQQINYIEAKVKEKPSEIEIMNFNSDYVMCRRIWEYSYCYYNEKQFDIEFKDLPFSEWYANRQAEGWY